MEKLPTQKIDSVVSPGAIRWLIEDIWLKNACGIIGGQPKCCKSWFGLEMAVAVASGTACLKKFRVCESGRVLVYMAEDKAEEIKIRVKNLADSRGVELNQLDLHLITVPCLRLDLANDCSRLESTLAELRPKILILDPLVRLHRLDENSAREISGLLGFLRELERKYEVAIVVTHHASKRTNSRPGQGLRGSSDLHAFGDSNLYLSRQGQYLKLSLEHRSANAIEPMLLKLETKPNVHFEIVSPEKTETIPKDDLNKKITALMENATRPLLRQELRNTLKCNNQRLGNAIRELVGQRKMKQTGDGYVKG